MKLTEKEIQFIKAFERARMGNDFEFLCIIEAHQEYDKIQLEGKTLSGVVSSLIKKEVILSEDDTDGEVLQKMISRGKKYDEAAGIIGFVPEARS